MGIVQPNVLEPETDIKKGSWWGWSQLEKYEMLMGVHSIKGVLKTKQKKDLVVWKLLMILITLF